MIFFFKSTKGVLGGPKEFRKSCRRSQSVTGVSGFQFHQAYQNISVSRRLRGFPEAAENAIRRP